MVDVDLIAIIYLMVAVVLLATLVLTSTACNNVRGDDNTVWYTSTSASTS